MASRNKAGVLFPDRMRLRLIQQVPEGTQGAVQDSIFGYWWITTNTPGLNGVGGFDQVEHDPILNDTATMTVTLPPAGSDGQLLTDRLYYFTDTPDPQPAANPGDMQDYMPGDEWIELIRGTNELIFSGTPVSETTVPDNIALVCNDLTQILLKQRETTAGFWNHSPRDVFEHYCNDPAAPIWMADLSFKPLGDVVVGDEVMGWESEDGSFGNRSGNRLASAVVEAVNRREAPLVKIRFASGRTVRCTPDHQWVVRERQGKYHYGVPRVGEFVAHVIDPTPPVSHDLLREAGWLGGMYDGEGSERFIAQYANVNRETHTRIGEVARLLGLDLRPTPRGYYIGGGRQGFLDFLAITQPTKRAKLIAELIAKRYRKGGGAWGSYRFTRPDRVVAIEEDGYGEVVSMTTSTGNYVAWGYASRNCRAWQTNVADDFVNPAAFPMLNSGSVQDSTDGRWDYLGVGDLTDSLLTLQVQTGGTEAYVLQDDGWSAVVDLGPGDHSCWRAECAIVNTAITGAGATAQISFGVQTEAFPGLQSYLLTIGPAAGSVLCKTINYATGSEVPKVTGDYYYDSWLCNSAGLLDSSNQLAPPYTMAIEARERWVYFYLDGQLVSVAPRVWLDPHDETKTHVRPFVKLDADPGDSVQVDYIILRNTTPPMNGGDPGDYVLPSTPSSGGLQGEYYDMTLAYGPAGTVTGGEQITQYAAAPPVYTPGQVRIDPGVYFQDSGAASLSTPAGLSFTAAYAANSAWDVSNKPLVVVTALSAAGETTASAVLTCSTSLPFMTQPTLRTTGSNPNPGGFLAGFSYFYVVTAVNAAGEETGTTYSQTNWQKEDFSRISGTFTSISLAWTAVPGATSYRVYRGAAAGSPSTIANSACVLGYSGTATTWTDYNKPRGFLSIHPPTTNNAHFWAPTVRWGAITNAIGYNVYVKSGGSWFKYGRTSGTSMTILGTGGGSAVSLPSSNTATITVFNTPGWFPAALGNAQQAYVRWTGAIYLDLADGPVYFTLPSTVISQALWVGQTRQGESVCCSDSGYRTSILGGSGASATDYPAETQRANSVDLRTLVGNVSGWYPIVYEYIFRITDNPTNTVGFMMASGFPGGAPIVDTFVRTAENPLSDSGAWYSGSGSPFGAVGLAATNGTAAINPGGSGSQAASLLTTASPTPVAIFCDIVTWPANSRLILAWLSNNHGTSSPTPTGYSLEFDTPPSPSNRVVAQKWNGGFSVIGSPVPLTLAAGDSVGMYLDGQNVTAWHKPSGGSWTLVGTWADSTYMGQTNYPGFNLAGASPQPTITNFGVGPTTTPPSAYVTSPYGCFTDQAAPGDSHFDTIQTTIGQSFAYNWSSKPMALESGAFPGAIVPRVRVGRDTDLVLDGSNADNPQENSTAVDNATTDLAQAQGLGGNSSGSLTAEAFNFAAMAAHPFNLTESENLPATSQLALLVLQMETLLALRSATWQQFTSDAVGQRSMQDSWPLSRTLAEFDWTPGDGLRVRIPQINILDTTPRQIMSLQRFFYPDGVGQTSVSFRPRPRNFMFVLRKFLRQVYQDRRTFQGQLVKVTGNRAVAPAYSTVPLPVDLTLIRQATLTVLSKDDSTTSFGVIVNGQATGQQVLAPGVLDLSNAIGRNDGIEPQMIVQLTNTAGAVDAHLSYVLSLTELVDVS